MAEEDVAATEQVEADEAFEEVLMEVEEPESRVALLKQARPVGVPKKRKIVHRTRTGKIKVDQAKIVPMKKIKEAASMDLSDPSQLTMKEIIRRAEAIERAKAREEAAKKAEEKVENSLASTTPARAGNTRAAQDTPAPSVLTPQVQIVNGRIVINQQSLVVAAQASTREDTETYRRVEEDRPKLNYNSYSNRAPVERWKAEDTDLFFKALQQFGTDFELLQNLFPGRTRRQVKAKFKNEEKLNPVRLADALGHKIQDQSHHYRAIIEMLKTEKGKDDEENLLDSLLLPVMRDETACEQTVSIQGQASTSENKADKVDCVSNVEFPVAPVVLEKVKSDEPTAPASGPFVIAPAVLPQSDVATTTARDLPASEDCPGRLPPTNGVAPESLEFTVGNYSVV